MKGLVVVASARKGSSQYIADRICDTLSDLQSDVLRISDYTINYCTGCLECDETHECNIHDDMTNILEKLLDADVLIMVSPARYSLLSGDAKVFIDRLNPTAVSGDIEGKKFISIAVGQTGEDEEIDSVRLAADSLEAFAENAGMEIVGKYCVYSCYGPEDIYSKEKEVKDIVLDIKKRLFGE